MVSVHEWIQPTQEKTKKPNLEVDHQLRHTTGGKRRVEAFPKNPKVTQFSAVVVQQSTVHNGNNMVSVHEWIQHAQEKTKKPNLEWGTTSATELDENQDLKPSQKIPKSPNFPRLLCNDP